MIPSATQAHTRTVNSPCPCVLHPLEVKNAQFVKQNRNTEAHTATPEQFGSFFSGRVATRVTPNVFWLQNLYDASLSTRKHHCLNAYHVSRLNTRTSTARNVPIACKHGRNAITCAYKLMRHEFPHPQCDFSRSNRPFGIKSTTNNHIQRS